MRVTLPIALCYFIFLSFNSDAYSQNLESFFQVEREVTFERILRRKRREVVSVTQTVTCRVVDKISGLLLGKRSKFMSFEKLIRRSRKKLRAAKRANSKISVRNRHKNNVLKYQAFEQSAACEPMASSPSPSPTPVSSPPPSISPSPSPTPSIFSANGDLTLFGKTEFLVPVELTANRFVGKQEFENFCLGCHEARGDDYDFEDLKLLSFNLMGIRPQDLPDDRLANIVAYLNRGAEGS